VLVVKGEENMLVCVREEQGKGEQLDEACRGELLTDNIGGREKGGERILF
jgi:hypothetical protein